VDAAGQEAWDALTAMLLQITQHAERLAVLDERETTHHQQIADRLTELVQQLADTTDAVTGMQATTDRQAAILDSLDGLDQQVAALAAKLTHLVPAYEEDGGDDSYQPAPTARWWKLTGGEREQAVTRLRAWVEQIYRPGFGHLAAALGPCWEQHSLCLYGLDWLMELWSILYLAPDRTAGKLGSQAEWQTRLLPALAEQMYLRDHPLPTRPAPRTTAVAANSPIRALGPAKVNADTDRQDHFIDESIAMDGGLSVIRRGRS
jgi:hypothetical protein